MHYETDMAQMPPQVGNFQECRISIHDWEDKHPYDLNGVIMQYDIFNY